jgi:Helix-turn-helix domain
MSQTTIPTNESEAKPQLKLALTREEAAGALSISTATIDRLTERGLLKPSRAIRRPLYPISEIERFLKETQGKTPRVKARHHE